jgi:chromosome segregation ATPase
VGNKTEHFTDSMDSLESIKMIFLKKLSTGFDEDTTHQKMLEDLDRKIKSALTLEQTKRKDLQQLVEEKKRYKEDQDREISNLREQLNKIREDEIDSINKLKERERKDKDKEDMDHDDKYKRHKNNVEEERKKLDEAEKKTEDLQSKQLQSLTQAYTKYTTSMKDNYDQELHDLKEKLRESKQVHAQVTEELMIVEDDYRRIKHEKEINEAIELEWQIKLQKFDMHENRKEKAAQFIVNMWKGWKENKKKKKKPAKAKPK